MAVPSYVQLETLKLALGMTKPGETYRDELLNIALSGAARAISRKTGNRRFDRDPVPTSRVIATVGRTLWDRRWREYRLMVPDIAAVDGLVVASETGVVEFSATPVAPDDPSEPITGILGSFPDRVRITAVWGWPETPDDIIQAQLLQAMRYYRRKDSPEGIAGSAEWGLVRIPRLDPDVAEMIEDYCFPAVA